jgi:hypothetical protein
LPILQRTPTIESGARKSLPGPELTIELLDLQGSDFDLSLTGFDTKEIDDFLLKDIPEEDAAPPLPAIPVTQPGDLWLCGSRRVLCGDATDAAVVSRLLGERQPFLTVTDPPYGIELDSEWRDWAGLNGCGAAEPSYLKQRTKGIGKPVFAATRAPTGPRRLRWFPIWK